MSVFWFFGPFFDYFFYCPKFQKWNFIKNPWYTKIQHCTTLIFLKKLDFFDFFLRKFLLTVLHIFDRKYTPNFQKIDFSIYPNILYICDQNFMLVPTIKLLEFSDKNWETYERLLIFWSIFWLFFLLSKVSKMKFHQKSLIHKNTTLYDIDFPQKIGFFRFFLRKFLLTVLHIFYRKYTPNFQKIDFSIYPNILYICYQNFMLNFRIKIEKLMSVFWFFGPFFDYFFYCPKFQKWNFIKNPWYTKIQHCTTLIFLKKLDFFDFF